MPLTARARVHSAFATALLGGSLLVVMAGRVAATDCKPLSLHGSLANPRPGDLFLRPGTTTCDQAEVEVTADAVAGVFTASFDVRYPAALVKYTGFSVGPLLLRAPVANKPLCLVQESSPGTLQITMTRFAPDGGVSAEGLETLLVLQFARVAPGSGDVDFNLDPASPVAERIVDDAGGTVAARFGPGHGLKLSVYQR
jgi:hypothetical protein